MRITLREGFRAGKANSRLCKMERTDSHLSRAKAARRRWGTRLYRQPVTSGGELAAVAAVAEVDEQAEGEERPPPTRNACAQEVAAK
jgi:hypothetical protein